MRSARLVAVLVIVLGVFAGVLAWRLIPFPSRGETSTTTPGENGRVGYVVTGAGATLSPSPGDPGQEIAANLIFPVTGEAAEGYEVLDNCNRAGWIAVDQVDPGFVPSSRSQD
ncbi:MAG: hypothetical protein ACRDWF_04115, partial [Acidimicrobiia bacterium]